MTHMSTNSSAEHCTFRATLLSRMTYGLLPADGLGRACAVDQTSQHCVSIHRGTYSVRLNCRAQGNCNKMAQKMLDRQCT